MGITMQDIFTPDYIKASNLKSDSDLSWGDLDNIVKAVYNNCKSEEEVNSLAEEITTDIGKFFLRLIYSFGVDNLDDFLFCLALVMAGWDKDSSEPIHYFWGIKETRDKVCKARKLSTTAYYKKLNKLIDNGIITKKKGTTTYLVNHKLYWNQYGEIGGMWYLYAKACKILPNGKYRCNNDTNTVTVKYKKENKEYLVYYDENNNVLYKEV